MLELLLFTIPSLFYVLVKGRKIGYSAARANVGWQLGTFKDFLLALALFPMLLALGYLGTVLIPSADLVLPGVVVAETASVIGILGVILRAVGEEIFFRGLLGGAFMRTWGFWAGNTAQAIVFLIPHFLLLAVDLQFWPMLPIQFVSGWILGALRHRSGSIVECAISHAALNLVVGLLAS